MRREDNTIFNDKNILTTTFRHITINIKHQGLIKPMI